MQATSQQPAVPSKFVLAGVVGGVAGGIVFGMMMAMMGMMPMIAGLAGSNSAIAGLSHPHAHQHLHRRGVRVVRQSVSRRLSSAHVVYRPTSVGYHDQI
jgi:hypothetical protein